MLISLARRSAFEILRRVESEAAFASVLLASIDQTLRSDDRALCHELVLGVLRHRLWLDRILEHFGKRSIERLDLPVRLALELGLYQLRFLSRIPPSAAVNESVNLVRVTGVKSAATFVNAVLRRATREPNYDPAAAVKDPIERVSIETSHPAWVIQRWTNAFGFTEAESLARANNQPSPVAFRLTARSLHGEQSAEEILRKLESAGALVAPSMVVPGSWRVTGNKASTDRDSNQPDEETGITQPRMTSILREFSRDGLIYLQDEASQLVAHALKAETGHRVLEAAAAPGSKATLLSTLAPAALIVAGDFYQHRTRTMRDLALLQNAQLHLLVHDATKPLPFPDKSFDRVLLDAPCSGTGTLRRNPEIRWRLKPEDITELSSQQRTMLSNTADLVRPGGRIVYSTCSVEVEENEDVVGAFLMGRPDFSRVELDAAPEFRTASGDIRTWPHRQGTEGFFVAGFERRN